MNLKRICASAMVCVSVLGAAGMIPTEKVSAQSSGIVIEAPETIVQLQLGTMRINVETSGKQELEKVFDLLEEVTPAGEDMQETLNRGEDFYGVLLIHEDGTKDKFYFFSQNDKWYMETEDGVFYENAEGLTDIVHMEEADVTTSVPEETVQYLISCDRDRKMLEYARKEGFYPTEEELSEMTEVYIEDMEKAENYKENTKLCEDHGISFAELIRNNNEFIIQLMVNSRFSEQRRIEYMEGQDTINGVTYSDYRDYEKAFLNEYVYSME